MTSKGLVIFLDSGDTLVDEASQEFDDRGIVTRAELYPGAAEALCALHREGFTVCMVVDGEAESFKNVYTAHGLYDVPDGWVISEIVGEQKPHKSMFLTAFEKLGLTEKDKRRVVMVGNNLKKDIAGANRLGLTSVWMDWSPRYFHTYEEADWEPDYIIRSPSELLPLMLTLEEKL